MVVRTINIRMNEGEKGIDPPGQFLYDKSLSAE
jgi:hypothetical protein